MKTVCKSNLKAGYIFIFIYFLSAFGCATEVTVSSTEPATAGVNQPPAPPLQPGTGPLPPTNPTQCGAQGSIRGIACDPNGGGIPGATVTVQLTDCTGNVIEQQVETSASGQYTVEVPAGSGSITTRAGSFERSREVTISPGQSLDLTGPDACLEASETRIAVFSGAYDLIELVIDQLGFERELFCGVGSSYGARRLLGDMSRLSQVDVLFINCGVDINFQQGDGPQLAQNLRSYVEGGGSVYVSDLAASSVAAAYPNLIQFELGNYDDEYYHEFVSECCTCAQNCPAQCGGQDDIVVGDSGHMCIGSLPIEVYDDGGMGGYSGMAGYDGMSDEGFVNFSDGCFASSYYGEGVEGVMSAQILNPSMRAALGRDSFNVNFDLGGWVRILSVSPEVETLIESNGQPLMVRYTSQAGGKLIYTSFHNKRQASDDLQKILKALIFQL